MKTLGGARTWKGSSAGSFDFRSRLVLVLNAALVVAIALIWYQILVAGKHTTTATTQKTSTPAATPVTVQQPVTTTKPATPKPAATGTTYVVQSGDTLDSVGVKLGVDWHKIADANSLKEPYALQVGQTLTIPK